MFDAAVLLPEVGKSEVDKIQTAGDLFESHAHLLSQSNLK